MPPDVLLLLASSGLTFVASLMFLVHDEAPPREEIDDPRSYVSFCLPPLRMQSLPPPLPARPRTDCAVDLSTTGLHSVVTMRPGDGDEWVVTLECAPLPDSPALQVRGNDGVGAVTDLRWHGKAGLAKPTKRVWKTKPGRA